MRITTIVRSTIIVASLLSGAGTVAAPLDDIGLPAAATPTSGPLYRAIASMDSELFDAVFNKCDSARVGELITDDFEFYHDKWGQIAASKKQFVDLIRNLCERQAKGIDYRARRELVKGSLRVYPLRKYGAIETGIHRFYRLTKGKKDQLTETARFLQVWKMTNGQWKLARVFSYDHRDVAAVPGNP